MVENQRIMTPQADVVTATRPVAIRPITIPTTGEAVERWLRHRHLYLDITDTTDEFYRQQIKALVALVGEETPVTEITYEDFEAVLIGIQERGCKMAAAFRAMKAFLRWCGRQGYPMDMRFAYGLETPKQRKTDENDITIFTPRQLKTLEEEMSGTKRNRLIYGLLLGTGPRVNELAMLALDSKEEFMLHIRWAKGKKHRRVPMSGQLREDWNAYVRKERPEISSNRLLVTEDRIRRGYCFDYHPIQKKAIQSLLVRIEKRVGFDCNPHKWRHTFATIWVMKHMKRGEAYDLDELRRYLGHESYDVLPVYVNLAKTLLPKNYERYLPY